MPQVCGSGEDVLQSLINVIQTDSLYEQCNVVKQQAYLPLKHNLYKQMIILKKKIKICLRKLLNGSKTHSMYFFLLLFIYLFYIPRAGMQQAS